MKNKALRFIIAVIAVMMSALPAKADERVDILIVDPTSGVIHRAPTQIGMNWGFSYSQQHHTDGDDLWFSYTNWSVFGYTFPYQRKMLSNIYRIQ